MSEANWQPIATAPENRMVMTKIDDASGERNVQQLRRSGTQWFTGEGGACKTCGQSRDGMYVYYRPTHWRLL